MSLNWYGVGSGIYKSGRYTIQRVGAKQWQLEVWSNPVSTNHSLGACKTKAEEIEDQRRAGNDPYFDQRPRKYRGRHERDRQSE